MEAWWNALDFGKRKNAAEGEGEEVAAVGWLHDVVAGDESPVAMFEENGLIDEEEPKANEKDTTLSLLL